MATKNAYWASNILVGATANWNVQLYLPTGELDFNFFFLPQGCGLRKITRSPKVPHHEILVAQHLSLYEKSKLFQLPKVKS